MNQLVVISVLRWLSLGWGAIVTLMVIGSVIASFILTGSFGEGLMRLTQLYGGLARIGYDQEAETETVFGNVVVIILLYAPAFVLYAVQENLRKKPSGDRE